MTREDDALIQPPNMKIATVSAIIQPFPRVRSVL